MCDNGKSKREHDKMAKGIEKSEMNKKDKKENLDKILAKGVNRYDKTLKKLSKN